MNVRRRVRRATSPVGPPRPAQPPVVDPAPPVHALPDPARQTEPVLDTTEALDDVDGAAAPAGGSGRPRPPLDLLIWDAPNIDMTLSTVIGARPTAASRPRFDAIAAWFVDGADGGSAPQDTPEVEACVFANIQPQPGSLQRWVEALRGFG